MEFNPIRASENIFEDYLRYIETTFFIKDQDYFQQFKKSLKEDRNFANGPFLDVTDSFEAGLSLEELIQKEIISSEFRSINSSKLPLTRPLYKHQEESIIKVSEGKNVVITTGTGSGKTESFLLPIINYLLKQKEENLLTPGVRALIIYPMNALANDQMKRMYELFENYPHITFGAYTGETEHSQERALKKYKRLNNREPLPNELISRDKMKENPPHILITNYAMLEYLMIRPEDNVFFNGEFSEEWKYVVLDEAHTYTGATGIEVSMLLRRLKAKLSLRQPLQFLLTSATLGSSVDSNPDILSFAKTLCCNESFETEGIIRAKRVKLFSDECKNNDFNLYLELADALENHFSSERIYEIIQKYVSYVNYQKEISEMLYDLLIHEERYYDLKNILSETTVTVEKSAQALKLSADELSRFVSVLSKARKYNISLFDARYHYFIRMLEGCYITLKPTKKLFIHPTRIYEGNQVFKFSVCRDCGEIYILGVPTSVDTQDGVSNRKIKFLKQSEELDKELDGKKIEHAYLLISDNYIPEDEDKVYTLCSKCGAIERSTSHKGHSCECGEVYINRLYKVDYSKRALHRCVVCDDFSARGNILRDFYMGQEAAASVLGTSLYGQLPSKETQIIQNSQFVDEDDEFGFDFNNSIVNDEVIETPRAKQYLIFSDSRQDAAYFSSYFDFTYHNILRRRLIVETLQQNKKYYGESLTFEQLVDYLEITFEKYQIFKKQDRKKEAFKTILFELGTTDRNSLENLGLFNFKYDLVDYQLKVFPEILPDVIQVLVNTFRKQFRLFYNDILPLSADDRSYFTYASKPQVMCLNTSNNVNENSNVQSWCSSEHLNTRADYLKRLTMKLEGNSWDINKINNFLTGVWKKFLIADEHLSSYQSEGYQLNVSGFKIYPSFSREIKWYYCDKCGKVTTFNAADICPEYRCNGTLKPFDIKQMEQNHYYKLYTTLDISDVIIKEHTAQLDVQTAKEYQEKFVNKEINILSCSTTFEMGVDVGDLETVFMKNMPPTPANYIQRAGRAGRRTDSAAYALTFCKLSSHDLTYFNNPVKMIKGNINPPKFRLENDKILKRHVNACVLAAYFQRHPESFNNVEQLFLTNQLDEFKTFVKERDTRLVTYLKNVLPTHVHCKIEEWLQDLEGDEGTFQRVFLEMNDEVNQLSSVLEEIQKTLHIKPSSSENYRAIRLINSINTIKKEKILSFLSRKNIIPKYGFPVDSIELNTMNDPNQKGQLRLSRDLSIAISEYAPESEIIANGYMYKSRYIKKPSNSELEWNMQDYGRCENESCGYLNMSKYTFDEKRKMPACRICGSSVKKEGTFLVPEYGFIAEDKVELATTRKPEKTYRGDIIYVGDQHELQSSEDSLRLIGNKVFKVSSTTNDELLVLNKSDFYICETCGYAKVFDHAKIDEIIKAPEHKTAYGRPCKNKFFKRRTLGHKFKTDVLYMSIQDMLDTSTALSVLYALLEGISYQLDIERNDISGCIHQRYIEGSSQTAFVLFDNVPGGAGHVRRIGLLDQIGLRRIFNTALEIVQNCKCGGEEADSACYSCLCNYQNQRVHHKLSRRKAIDWLKEVIE